MERIKQALEKARLERQQSEYSTSPSASRSDVAHSQPLIYSQTRITTLAKDILQERRVIAGFEQNIFTDAYKILRTQILQRLREKNWNSLAITSAGADEGKTSVAINLAISLAMEVNYTVLLVDADLRHPAIHNFLGISAEYGLSDYLTADKPLSELLIHPEEIPGFVLLPGGKQLTNSAEMLSSPKMIRLVEELKNRYPSRIILFDLPPLLNAADTLAFSPYVDAALLVIEDGKTQAEDVKRAIALLQGTNVIGTVLNKSWVEPQDGDNFSRKRFIKSRKLVSKIQSGSKNWLDRLRQKKN